LHPADTKSGAVLFVLPELIQPAFGAADAWRYQVDAASHHRPDNTRVDNVKQLDYQASLALTQNHLITACLTGSFALHNIHVNK